jgi:hypothetical protein
LSLLPKKKAMKKKAVIIIMKEEDEVGEKVEKAGKHWADGEVLHLIPLHGKMELEFIKNAKKQGKFQFIQTL